MDESSAGMGMLSDVTLPERYELVAHLATGGMASVWCARDRVLGRRVAIKLLAERFAYDEAAVRRFKREARTAAQLSGHMHVVTIYDVGETIRSDPAEAAQAFIVMEYLPGGTAADALRAGAVRRDEAVRWLHESASALDYAHSHGVLHRDIKPANLLLDHDRAVHVADFGIAQLASEETLTLDGQVLGTAAYLAPERVRGRPATEASDRYSMAVAAFELLVGERPFGAERFAAQARQHIEAPVPRASERNPRLPPALDDVLARGMAKRPEERWPTCRAFAEAVELALAETVVRRPAPAVAAATAATAATAAAGVAAPARPRAQRRAPRRTIAIGALAGAAVAVGVALAASNQSSPHHTSSSARGQGSAVAHAAPRHAAAKPRTKPKPAPRPKPQAHTTTQPAQPQVTTTSSAQSTPPPTANTLEARGHTLMESGNYVSAIPVLRQALATAPPSSLTYAYALFDLGRSLRLSGDPRAAVPILYKRLQIPNQTGVVRFELEQALRALGRDAQKHGGGVPGTALRGAQHGSGGPGAADVPGRGLPGSGGAPTVPGLPGGNPPGLPGQGGQGNSRD